MSLVPTRCICLWERSVVWWLVPKSCCMLWFSCMSTWLLVLLSLRVYQHLTVCYGFHVPIWEVCTCVPMCDKSSLCMSNSLSLPLCIGYIFSVPLTLLLRLSNCQFSVPNFLSIFLSFFLSFFLSVFISFFISIFLYFFLSFYLYLSLIIPSGFIFLYLSFLSKWDFLSVPMSFNSILLNLDKNKINVTPFNNLFFNIFVLIQNPILRNHSLSLSLSPFFVIHRFELDHSACRLFRIQSPCPVSS